MDKEKVDFNWDDDSSEDKKGGLSDIVKKVVASAMTSPFLSEDQLKVYLSGLNLPKEVITQVLRGAQKSKQDLVNRVGLEVSKVLSKIDIVKELKKALREHKISIQADIEFVPKDKSTQDSASSSDDEL
tara:strand:+ start:796 stop:1182 length:387 start_codon:yes stop_codon:yes gene_type:complete